MRTTATYFVYGPRAYRGEISLYRHEGVTAQHATAVEAPAGARELWCIDCYEREDSIFTHDGAEALRALQTGNVWHLCSVTVID